MTAQAHLPRNQVWSQRKFYKFIKRFNYSVLQISLFSFFVFHMKNCCVDSCFCYHYTNYIQYSLPRDVQESTQYVTVSVGAALFIFWWAPWLHGDAALLTGSGCTCLTDSHRSNEVRVKRCVWDPKHFTHTNSTSEERSPKTTQISHVMQTAYCHTFM